MRGSKTEYDKFKDADASYQNRESYKIVVEPMSSVYVHECLPESPAQGKIGSSWLTEGKRCYPHSLSGGTLFVLVVGDARVGGGAGGGPLRGSRRCSAGDGPPGVAIVPRPPAGIPI